MLLPISITLGPGGLVLARHTKEDHDAPPHGHLLSEVEPLSALQKRSSRSHANQLSVVARAGERKRTSDERVGARVNFAQAAKPVSSRFTVSLGTALGPSEAQDRSWGLVYIYLFVQS